MEIEVGEYGRTNKGKIFIFVWVENANYILVKTRNEKPNNFILNFDKYYLDKDEEILKHSKNIIDLVEVGDYVNALRVEQVSIETNEVLLDHNGFRWRTLKDGDKIVTHEQFASIEYKVEEEK